MKKKNKNSGWCIIIYGYAGAGKSEISMKIKKDLEKMIGKTIVLDGDEVRSFFSKIGLKFGYTKKARNKTVIPKLELLNLILKKNINIIYPTIFLNKLAIQKWSKGIDNLIKVHIKTDIKKIITFGARKKFYETTKDIVGINIKPVFPGKPQITVENDFKKGINSLSKKVLSKLSAILKYN
ncbi:adenylyl-sulfate kinase [Pelagibacterales bacterium SAG-MED39]|nr:adenylyl-sulfate kinase [Pelagibacterales bacterium SAG-MED39]